MPQHDRPLLRVVSANLTAFQHLQIWSQITFSSSACLKLWLVRVSRWSNRGKEGHLLGTFHEFIVSEVFLFSMRPSLKSYLLTWWKPRIWWGGSPVTACLKRLSLFCIFLSVNKSHEKTKSNNALDHLPLLSNFPWHIHSYWRCKSWYIVSFFQWVFLAAGSFLWNWLSSFIIMKERVTQRECVGDVFLMAFEQQYGTKEWAISGYTDTTCC